MGSEGKGTRNVGLEQVSSSCWYGAPALRMGGEYQHQELSFQRRDQDFTYRLVKVSPIKTCFFYEYQDENHQEA